MLAGSEVEREEVAGRSSERRGTSVVTHPRREPPLDWRDPTLPIHRMNAGAGSSHRRGGNILIAVDEEGIGLPATYRTHYAAGLMVGSMDGCSICFTLHIDAPNRGIRGPLRWRW